MTERYTPAWQGSDRREELPPNWDELRAEATRRNPEHICHWCKKPGGEVLDHKNPGSDHSQENLDWIHGWRSKRDGVSPRNCDGQKTSAEGHAARIPLRRPPKKHPGLR